MFHHCLRKVNQITNRIKTNQIELMNQNQEPPPPPLPRGWTQLYDSEYGRCYYHNEVLKATQWERPDMNRSWQPPLPCPKGNEEDNYVPLLKRQKCDHNDIYFCNNTITINDSTLSGFVNNNSKVSTNHNNSNISTGIPHYKDSLK